MPNFPGSLDTTGSGTLPTNHADGSEIIHASTVNDLATVAVAVETKLGSGASVPTTAGHVLTVTGAGATGYAAAPGAGAPAQYLSVKQTGGARGDCKKLLDGAITSGAGRIFTSATAVFTSADVGKRIYIVGAGAAAVAGTGGILGPLGQLDTTIVTFTNATTVVVGANATTTVSSATFYYGTDDTSAINATITAAAAVSGGTGVWIDAGMYVVNGINAQSNVDIISDAATLVHMGGGVNSHIISMVGTTSTSSVLTGNVALDAATVTVTSATGFSVGDFVLLRDNTYKVTAISAGRNQEINRIAAISGTTFTLVNLTMSTYTTAQTATLLRLAPVNNVLVEGLILENPVGQDIGGNIILTYCYNVSLNALTCLRPSDDPGIYVIQSAVTFINNCYVRDGQDRWHTGGGYGYGVILEESNHGVILTNCNTEGIRENSLTYNCRYCIVTNHTDIGAVDSSFNTHGTGNEGCGIVNSTSLGSGQASNGSGYGFYIGGGRTDSSDIDCFISGCLVVNSKGHGIMVSGGDATHRTLRCSVTNNVIKNPGASTAGSMGIEIFDADNTLVSGNLIICPSTNSTLSWGIWVTESSYANVTGNMLAITGSSAGIGVHGNTLGCANCTVTNNTIQSQSPSFLDLTGPPANTNLIFRNNVCSSTNTYTNTTIAGGNIVNSVLEPMNNPVSTTAVAIATAGTVAVGNLGISRLNPAGIVTGIIIAAGTFDGQPLTVINQSAFLITFAASGTSRVSDGTSSTVPTLTARTFTWNASTSLWYPSK